MEETKSMKLFRELLEYDSATALWLNKLADVMRKLSPEQFENLRIVECSDEYTGRRYGRAKCRVGQCAKLGRGGRNKGSKHIYQLWADWSVK